MEVYKRSGTVNTDFEELPNGLGGATVIDH